MSETEADAPGKKRRTKFYPESGEIELEGKRYGVAPLSEAVLDHLTLHGLRYMLVTADDPAAAYAKLMAGDFRAPERQEKVNPWRMAGAHVHAKAAMKQAGLRPLPGKPIHEHPGYPEKLAAGLAFTREWTPDDLRDAKLDPAIVEEHGRLTGKPRRNLFATPELDEAA